MLYYQRWRAAVVSGCGANGCEFKFWLGLPGGGQVVRLCWVNFQCRGVLLIWIRVGQGPTALAVGAEGGCLDIFSLRYPFSPLSPALWETARYRLKYCLKGPLNPKQSINQWAIQELEKLNLAVSGHLIRNREGYIAPTANLLWEAPHDQQAMGNLSQPTSYGKPCTANRLWKTPYSQ